MSRASLRLTAYTEFVARDHGVIEGERAVGPALLASSLNCFDGQCDRVEAKAVSGHTL